MKDSLKKETVEYALQHCLDKGHLKLRAINPERGVFRDYEIHISQGLFGTHVVQLAYGRIGARGRLLNHGFETQESAASFIKKCLKKRLTSGKRIGCAYQLTFPSSSMQSL